MIVQIKNLKLSAHFCCLFKQAIIKETIKKKMLNDYKDKHKSDGMHAFFQCVRIPQLTMVKSILSTNYCIIHRSKKFD